MLLVYGVTHTTALPRCHVTTVLFYAASIRPPIITAPRPARPTPNRYTAVIFPTLIPLLFASLKREEEDVMALVAYPFPAALRVNAALLGTSFDVRNMATWDYCHSVTHSFIHLLNYNEMTRAGINLKILID